MCGCVTTRNPSLLLSSAYVTRRKQFNTPRLSPRRELLVIWEKAQDGRGTWWIMDAKVIISLQSFLRGNQLMKDWL